MSPSIPADPSFTQSLTQLRGLESSLALSPYVEDQGNTLEVLYQVHLCNFLTLILAGAGMGRGLLITAILSVTPECSLTQGCFRPSLEFWTGRTYLPRL